MFFPSIVFVEIAFFFIPLFNRIKAPTYYAFVVSCNLMKLFFRMFLNHYLIILDTSVVNSISF